MNKAQRQAYSDKHIRRQKLFERQHIKPVIEAIDKQISEVVKDLRKDGIDKARNNAEQVLLNEDMATAIKSLYISVGFYAAKKADREIRTETKAFGLNEEFINSILNYFKSYLLEYAVTPVTQEIRNFILDRISKGTYQGWGAEKIARAIQSDSGTFMLWKSRLIVRTESAKAHFYGQQLAEEKSQWQSESEWIAANDHRTRHSHRLMDGETVDTGQAFKVPVYKKIGMVDALTGYDMMKGPGDPTASIENLANCRCTKAKRAKRDENGRLIPKVQNLISQ